MAVELAVGDLLRGRDDRLAEAAVEPAERHVGFRRRLLDDPESPHHRRRLLFPADAEVPQTALGLGAPIPIGRNLDRAEGVGLGARRRVGGHEARGFLTGDYL